jgi:plastocyanin
MRGHATCRVRRNGRSRLAGGIATLAVLVVLAGVAACGQVEPTSSPPPGAEESGGPRLDTARAGTLAGVVRYDGVPPRRATIDMARDPVCMRESRGRREAETLLVDAGGGLRNVFVYVKNGLDARAFDTPDVPAVLEQKGCRFTPRVFGVMTGQPIEIVNGDPTLHNVHAVPAVNDEFSVGQAVRGMKHTRTFAGREVMVPIRCDVHNWMRAYVGVLDHPYFAVTDEEGRFVIPALPAGTYTIEAWHESLGVDTAEITVAPGQTTDVAFVFKAG